MHILFCLVTLFTVFLCPSLSWAQAAFKVNPPVIDITVGRGGTKVFEFELANSSQEESQHFRIYALDFDMGRDGNSLFHDIGTEKNSCSSWLKVEPTDVTVKPGESKKILAKLTVPAHVTSGGYYSAITCELIPKTIPKIKTGSVITWRIATIVKTTVIGGAVPKKAVIDTFAMRTLFEEGKTPKGTVFNASLQNQSNIHVTATGKLTILTPDRRRKGEVAFDVGTGTILPQHYRDFTAVYDKFLPVGDYIAKATFRYGGTEALEKEIPFSIQTASAEPSGDSQTWTVESLKFIPEALKFKVPEGGFKIAGLTIQNQRNETLHIKLSVEDSKDIKNWITLEPSDLLLEGGKETKIVLKLAVPQQAATGEKNATIQAAPSIVNPDSPEEPLDIQTVGVTLEIPKI